MVYEQMTQLGKDMVHGRQVDIVALQELHIIQVLVSVMVIWMVFVE